LQMRGSGNAIRTRAKDDNVQVLHLCSPRATRGAINPVGAVN